MQKRGDVHLLKKRELPLGPIRLNYGTPLHETPARATPGAACRCRPPCRLSPGPLGHSQFRLSVGVTLSLYLLFTSDSRVCLLENRNLVGFSASRSAGLLAALDCSDWWIGLRCYKFDTRSDTESPDPTLRGNDTGCCALPSTSLAVEPRPICKAGINLTL